MAQQVKDPALSLQQFGLLLAGEMACGKESHSCSFFLLTLSPLLHPQAPPPPDPTTSSHSPILDF